MNFQQTAAQRFPAQADELNAAFTARLQALRAENAGASQEKQRHLENQILPGIAAYETLQSVMSKEEALQTVHGYVEQKAWRMKRLLLKLMRIPGLYRRVPGIFARETPEIYSARRRLCSQENRTTGGASGASTTRNALSRRLRTLRLSGAVPLLLRQRRYHL